MRELRLPQAITLLFADHDDELTPHALFQCVKALNENRDIRILYSDEDKMSMDGH